MDFTQSPQISYRRLFAPLAVIGTGLLTLIALVGQPLVTPVPSTPPPVAPARLEAHVKKLSVDLYPRSFDRAGNLKRTAAYIAEQFKEAGALVSFQDVVVDEAHFKNVVARFGPASGRLLVIGAHYDSYGGTPGADDNASGIAGVLELAHLLGRSAPARPVELVAYTLEEPPHFRSRHMGSVWHARALKAEGRDVELMLSLEMIGYFSDRPGSQAYPLAPMKLGYPDRGNFIALVGQFGDFGVSRSVKAAMSGASDLPVYSLNAPGAVQGVDFSDHRSYWAQGYPALMVTDTAFMRNPNYHGAGDTFDKLDYKRMAMVVQAVYAVAKRAAEP
ncbi:M28 family peptidase [Pseudoduganella violaceinigra]|uniref:M28 family peptidase n=1 Tax=Pseudoduganella violaceinigra TaxID=246602 RepID=UPI00040BE99C|nr:M28 family peptidase [Pseudoduganella violaceinigra]